MSEPAISNRPYIIRAMYEWMVDNDWTPHMQVDANYPGIKIPRAFVKEGGIVFNVSPSAVQALDLQNDYFQFRARFQGVEQVVLFPPEAVLAIFARENGQGMPFPPEPYPDELEEHVKPTLSAVKQADKGTDQPDSFKTDSAKSKSEVAKSQKKNSAKNKAKKPVKKPTLSVVK